MDKIKQIGFKAGEKPKRPVIQEDTSASKSYASIAYGISEGEIVGLIDGAKSVYLDGTPVMSVSGDTNIPDVKIQERKGTNDQTHLEGFPAVVNEKQYNNIEMLQTTPFVHYINDTNLDAVGIRFTFGALQETNPDNGNVSGTTIEYAIDVQADGQGYQELLRTSIVGKYSAGYQRYHRIELPQADEGWEVRVRRITPNTTSTYIADKMYLDAVAEILDVKMRYPNTALIGLKFDSERFSNIPKVDFRMRGKIIRVPANYDPVARTYAQSGAGTTNGIWNGQFKMAYTTNPAWIFYDLVLNRRYGLGNRIDASMLDKWSLYSIAQYCDVMVPDGEGGLEPRFTCNVYINNRFEAYDCLMQLAGVFRGIMYWSGTAIIAGCDRPQDPVFSYTRANIVGEFNYSGTRTKDRHSVVMVSFDDPRNSYKTEKEVVSDRKAISEIGIRTKDLAAFACTSRGQAQRAGKWALFKEQLETRIVTFALGMDGYIAPVGRIIEIADPLLAGRAIGGRIATVSADKTTITLDRDTEVKVGDRLVLNNEEGEQESRQVTSVSGRSVTVAVAFESPAVEHVWAIDSDDLQLMRFTVISVAENRSQDSINFTVTALQHEPSLHEAADYSAYVDRNTYSTIDITTQKAPTEVVISSVNRINQGIDLTDLVISWKQAENAVKYQVQWRRDDGNWIQMPLQYGNQVTVENIYHGVYEAKVVAINAADVNSLPASSAPTPINSKFAEPATLASLTAKGILLGVELNWKFPLYGAQNAAFVEIYWALNSDKSDSKLLGSYAYPTSETTINGLSPHLTLYFQARLVDRNGVASGFTPWVTATVEANPEKLLDILSGHINEGTLDQILKGKIDGALGLAGEANSLAGQANAAAANAQNTANQATVKAQEAANAVVQEAIDRAAALQDGITQVTTDYSAGDAVVLGELVAYKASNDSAVATVVQKAESAVATGSTNSQAITEITGQVQAINNTKLDASVISNYYTKGQADDKSAEIVAGQLTTFKSVFAQGGDNLLINSNVDNPYIGTYPHGRYALGESWEVGATYTLLWCASFIRHSFDQNDLVLAAYAGGGFQNLQRISAEGERQVHKATFVVRPEGTGYNEIHFYLLNSNGGYLTAVATVHWAVLVKSSDVLTNSWVRSKYDIDNAIKANAQAIRNTETAVATIDGEVTAQATDILNLETNLTNLNNSKLDASIIQQYRTAIEQDSVTAGSITQFSSALKLGGDNLFTGTKTFNNEAADNSNSSFQPSYGGFGGNSQVFMPYGLFGTHTVVKTSSSWCGFYLKEADWLGWEAREDLVLSFWAKADADVYAYGIASQLGHVAIIPASQSMIKYEVILPKGTPLRNAANQGIVEFDFPNGGTLWYGAVMLQIGTKSTAWQPSSKESDAAVGSLATAITETNTRVGNVEGGIASQANQLTSLSARLNERKVYQLYSGGLASATGGMGWLRGFDPNSYYDIGRSYGLVVFNGDGSIQSVNSYDVYGGNTQGFVDAVSSIHAGTYVAVLTSDEPRNHSVHIKGALKSLGGSDAIDQVVERGAYLLVGRKGLPTGQAIEKVSNTPSFGVDYVLEMFNGVPIGLGGSSPQSDIVSNMRTVVSSMDGNVKSLSETVTVHTASLGMIARGTYSKSHVLDLRGLDENLYYPVVIPLASSSSSKLRILRTLGSFSERPSWSIHDGGFDCKLEWVATGDGWGTTSRDLTILANDYRWTSAAPFLGLGQLTEISYEFVHLRGGAQYYLDTSSSASDPRIVTSAEYHHGRVLAPMPYTDGYDISAPDLKLKASASALEETRSEVRSIDGIVSSQASQILILESDNAANKNALTVQSRVIDGVKASYMVKMESNGVIGGFGMIQETGAMGAVITTFGVNADTFYIGSPSLDKKPFIQRNDWSLINGVWVPPGTYIDTAYIGAATIGTAHINDLAVTTAKIGDGQITTAKIGNAQVDTLQIAGEAVTVPTSISNENTYTANYSQYTQVPHTFEGNLAYWEDLFGTIATITINRKGGKVRFDATLIYAGHTAINFWGQNPSTLNNAEAYTARAVLSIYRGSTLVGRTEIGPNGLENNNKPVFSGTYNMLGIIDETNITGSTTYTLKFGLSNRLARGGRIVWGATDGYFSVKSPKIIVTEMKR